MKADNLSTALFGADWDLSVVEKRLCDRQESIGRRDEVFANHHLLVAIEAMEGARASLDWAEQIVARRSRKGKARR